MTPAEKAMELVEEFLNQTINFPFIDSDGDQCVGAGYMTYKSAIQCALIAVDEIIKATPETIAHPHYGSAMIDNPDIDYWQQVKYELEKL